MSNLKVGDQFKFRLDRQHMWFEVLEVLPDRYKAELLNNPFRGEWITPEGNAVVSESDYQRGDVIEISRVELAEYEAQRAALLK